MELRALGRGRSWSRERAGRAPGVMWTLASCWPVISPALGYAQWPY